MLTHPEPMQAAAPSPRAGNQGMVCKAGHAEAYMGVNPCTRSCRSPRGGNCSDRTSSTFISSVSQACARVCNMPVPEAIERLQTERPRKWRYRYSPKDSHQGIRINRNLAFVRNRELVTTLCKDMRQRVPDCIKKQCSRR